MQQVRIKVYVFVDGEFRVLPIPNFDRLPRRNDHIYLSDFLPERHIWKDKLSKLDPYIVEGTTWRRDEAGPYAELTVSETHTQ